MALVDAPMLMALDGVVAQLPTDVVARAKTYLRLSGNGKTGAYSDPAGHLWVREAIASFIARRDEDSTVAPDPQHIIADGATNAVRIIMQLLIAGPSDGVLIPIPQFPLFTALISLCGGTVAPYYLDESVRWGFNVQNLEMSVQKLKDDGVTPRIMVVINPGNPTGQVFTRDTMEDVVRFCHEHNIILLADEVYQDNIYGADRVFHSFRKVILSMPSPYNTTSCISLHSTSKGAVGECSRRGGYMELLNIAPNQRAQMLKLCSINLSSNFNGQVMTALMCSPPVEGDESYPLFRKEYDFILSGLKERAELLTKELNSIEGISCNSVDGAMYAFPQIYLPPKYVARCAALAQEEEVAADARWALELLEATGVVVVPGSGFLQQQGTFHFRTTILPPQDQMMAMTSAIRAFHTKIMESYA
ncbi:alanine aminotransferase, putative [Bodo saltans]|uniref:Alanine aminotransferase, putative n=1 Tax=Bodo saltans TaxID=75058 RepID=A0A0S4KND1_BODSA|nr:alanine aminotransferase, putative [Bodo saltans]|eukprot:CUI15044.1 alanine aminotransferase, putative [Bodo saltans]